MTFSCSKNDAVSSAIHSSIINAENEEKENNLPVPEEEEYNEINEIEEAPEEGDELDAEEEEEGELTSEEQDEAELDEQDESWKTIFFAFYGLLIIKLTLINITHFDDKYILFVSYLYFR